MSLCSFFANLINYETLDKKFGEFFTNYFQKVSKIEREKFPTTEPEYTESKAALEKVLSDEQKTVLAELEKSWHKNVMWAATFGFFQGIRASDRMTSMDEEEALFDKFIVTKVLTNPNIKDYPQYYDEHKHTLQLSASLEAQLDDEGKAHLVSIDCAWDEKLYRTLRDVFHMGLLIDKSNPPQKKK